MGIQMTSSSKEYFDSIGSGWDEMQEQFFDSAVREKAFSTANVVPGKTAADIGAGTGFITAGLLERGATVIAVDQSEEMLKAIKDKYPTGKVDCRVGAAESLPVDTGSVEYVFANMYLHHVEDPPSAIAEMARLLKPNGVLVITDLDKHEFEFLRTEQFDRWMGFSRDDVYTWFQQAGLIQVQVDCVGESCCSTSTEGEDAAISIFVASGTAVNS